MKYVTFTADATLTFGKAPRNTTVSFVATGTFGSGSVTFGTLAKDGVTFVPFTDPSAVTAAGNGAFFLGKGTTLLVDLAGATTPNLDIGVSGDHFEYDNSIY